jgi:hypothetical protein
MSDVQPGWQVFASDGHLLGQVDAVFADYLLVRTAGLLPVDLYVPTAAILGARDRRLSVQAPAHRAYDLWHRPLKSAPHG